MLPDRLVPLAVVVGMLALGAVVLRLIALMGWDLLKRYRTSAPVPGRTFSMTGGLVGGAMYRGMLSVTVGPDGLGLSSFAPFHPRLLVPWADVTEVEDKKVLFGRITRIRAGRPGVWLELPTDLGDAVRLALLAAPEAGVRPDPPRARPARRQKRPA